MTTRRLQPFIVFLATILLVVLYCPGSIFAQDNLYISSDGDNTTGDGSRQAPFRTLSYATSQAQPGDSVFVLAGTYRNEGFGDNDIWEGSNLEKITANGTPDNYITILPYPGDKVLFEFDATYGILVINSSYLRIVGLEIKGMNDRISHTEAIAAWGLYKDQAGLVHDLATELNINLTDPGIIGTVIDKPSLPNINKPGYYNGRGLVANKSHHIEFINNIVHDCPASAIRGQQSDFVIIRGNKVYNNTFWTTQGVGAITIAEATNINNDTSDEIKISLVQNEVFNNENRLISWNPAKSFITMVIDEGTGLFLTRNRDTYDYGRILIANNLSYNNGASGIVCHFTNRSIIEHNTVVYNGTTNSGQPGGIGINNADNVRVINNISYARPNKWALGILAEPVTNLIVENNIIFNNYGEEVVFRKIEAGWTEENPKFADLANNDFNLLEGSPGIDNGSLERTTAVDFFGSKRVDGFPDIGAIEYEKVTGIGLDEKKVNNVGVYPNPGNGGFTIFGINNSADIYCWNYHGRKVAIDITEKLDNKVSIQLKMAANGIYLLLVNNQTFKLVVDSNHN